MENGCVTEIKTKGLVVVGDIHGEFSELLWRIKTKKIEDTTFIIAGDCGIGFDKSLSDIYRRKRFDKKLGDSGNTILCIRGNHDDPKYFKYPDFIDFPCLKTVSDYSHLTWGDRKILIIGGGISVDKEWRLKEEEKTGKKCWWEDEGITRDSEGDLLDRKEDIIISHMAPICFGPSLVRLPETPWETWAAERSDREYLSTILKETRPEMWIFGHYHKSTSGFYEDCLWRGLDIMEMYGIRQYTGK